MNHTNLDDTFVTACREGDLELVKFLHSQKNSFMSKIKELYLNVIGTSLYDDAFCVACENGHTEVAKWFYDIGYRTCNLRPFALSCRNGHIDTAQWLVTVCSHVVQINIRSITEIFWNTCIHGHINMAQWVLTYKYARYIDKDEWFGVYFGCVISKGRNNVVVWLKTIVSSRVNKYFKDRAANCNSNDPGTITDRAADRNGYRIAKLLSDILPELIIENFFELNEDFMKYIGLDLRTICMTICAKIGKSLPDVDDICYQSVGYHNERVVSRTVHTIKHARTEKSLPYIDDIFIESVCYHNKLDILKQLSTMYPFIEYEVVDNKVVNYSFDRNQVKSNQIKSARSI